MKPRVRTGIIIGSISLILIVLGVFWVLRTLNASPLGGAFQQVATATPEPTVKVAFAVNDMLEGHIISAEDVTLNDIPAQFAPRDAVGSLDTIIGRILKAETYAGEMILSHNVADPTNKIFDIAYVLDDNHVLMALPATDLMSRESLIQRGDIVDLMVSYQTDLTPTDQTVVTTENTTDTGPQQVTFTAFQRLGITAMVVDIINTDENTPASVAATQRQNVVVRAYLLAMDPQDALVLKYINDAGGLFDFALRAPTSSGEFTLTPVTNKFIKELYGLDLLP